MSVTPSKCTTNRRMASFRACKPRLYPYSVPSTASLVNLTLKMRYKNDIKSSSPDSFLSSKCTKIRFRPVPRTPLGALTTRPRPPSRLGRGIPLYPPFSSPLDAFGVSNSAPRVPRFSGPTQHNFLAIRQWVKHNSERGTSFHGTYTFNIHAITWAVTCPI